MAETVAMEDLFAPCDPRFLDNVINVDPRVAEYYEEVELTTKGAESGLTNGAWDWAEVRAFLQEKIVWFSPEVCIVGSTEWFTLSANAFDCVLKVAMEFDDDNGNFVYNDDFRIFASSSPQGRVGCERILEYLSSAFDRGKLTFGARDSEYHCACPVSGPALSRFLSQSHGTGTRNLRLLDFELDADQCQALVAGDLADDLVTGLDGCTLADDGTRRIFFEGIHHSRGPAIFVNWHRDASLLLEALRGNTSVKELELTQFGEGDESLQLPMHALAENLGLVKLTFYDYTINDETWSAMCESLSPHPTLETLNLPMSMSYDASDDDSSTSTSDAAARKATRTESLAAMLRINTKITSIDVRPLEYDHELFAKEVSPRLKLNSYRPRFRAVKRIEGTLREPLLGRALVAVAHDASLMFLLFSGSTDIDWVALRRTRRSRKRVRYTQ